MKTQLQEDGRNDSKLKLNHKEFVFKEGIRQLRFCIKALTTLRLVLYLSIYECRYIDTQKDPSTNRLKNAYTNRVRLTWFII